MDALEQRTRSRTDPPPGSVGATLSGSGPTVIVWVDRAHAPTAAAELDTRVRDARVLPLRIADQGAAAA